MTKPAPSSKTRAFCTRKMKRGLGLELGILALRKLIRQESLKKALLAEPLALETATKDG